MTGINFYLLGSFKVCLDGAELTGALRTRKECAFLAYLAEESERPLPRETVAELLWPGRPEKFARMNLRQALLGIRKAFGDDEITNSFLSVTESTLQVNRERVWLDTAAFTEMIRAANSHAHQSLHTCPTCIDRLEKAVQYYRGNFLEDLILGDVSGFEEWLVIQRERHFRQMTGALQALARAYFKQANYEQAYLYAWRTIDMAPLEEAAHRLLMRVLYLTGKRNAALEQYQAFKEIMQRELGVEPSSATTQLYKNIKQELPIERMDTGSLTLPAASRHGSTPAPQPTFQLYDPNTQLPLQPLLMDRLLHAISRMERHQLGLAVCVLSARYIFDQEMTPELKKQAEQHLVSRLIRSVRKSDTVACLREDVYALILEEIQNPRSIPLLTQKIVRAVSMPIHMREAAVEVRLSIGSSFFPLEGADAVSLLNLADNAMRAARLQAHFSLSPPAS